MTQLNTLQNRDMATRHYTRGDTDVYVIDLGVSADPSLDVVGDTAIITFGDPDRDQLDIDLPTTDATAELSNGILTIKVNQ